MRVWPVGVIEKLIYASPISRKIFSVDGILVAAVIESEIVCAIIGAVFLVIYPIPTGP